jgi:heme oxygenase
VEARLLSRLDEATANWHPVVELPWIRLALPSSTRAEYCATLIRTYGFVAPLECACRYTPHLDRAIETRALTRSGLLAQDLLSLDLSPTDLTHVPQCYWISPFRDVPEAIGWLYVLYRQARVLGNYRHRITEHDRRIDDASSYIAAVGQRASAQWSAFENLIERLSAHDDEIVAAALVAFASLERWRSSTDFESWRRTA